MSQREESIRAALRLLPQEQLDLVRLAFFEGLSHGDIAAQTGLPLGTVKSRLRLAFTRLRRALEQEGVTRVAAVLRRNAAGSSGHGVPSAW